MWLTIPGFENYQISQYAVIQHKVTGAFVSPKPVCKGRYLGVALFKNGKRYTRNLHNLVMLTFRGTTPKGMIIDHIDDNRYNNCLSNLQFITPRQNTVKYFASTNWKTKREIARMEAHMRSIGYEA